jgi:Domain of unknown function (DUF4145)
VTSFRQSAAFTEDDSTDGNDLKGSQMRFASYEVTCPSCHQKIKLTDKVHGFEPFPYGGYLEEEYIWSYVFAECEICRQTLAIRRRIDESTPGHRKGVFEILWPVLERNLSDSVPESLRQEHYEARACFNAKSYTATVVMVRRTLEGVCADHGITRKPLYAALDEMKSNGLIEGRLLEWAQGLRVLGNDAAHFTGRPVSSQDAKDALSLAEALMDYMYVFTAQFEQFRARRDGQSTDGTSTGDS